MDYFEYRDGELVCENVRVADIAARFGTPAYIYSAATLEHHYRAIAEAFAELDPLVCFSVKSLSNVHILRLLVDAGAGLDVVSGGELARAKTAGAEMGKVVFAGVGKTDREIAEAIEARIRMLNVESESEFENLSSLAAQAGTKVRAALRVNPDVDPDTHRYLSTGRKATKFGVDIDRAEDFFDAYGRDEHVTLDGVHFHIGSPVFSAEPYAEAVAKSLALIETLRSKGFEISTLDIGGGFAVDYEQDASPLASDYAERIVPLLKGAGLEIILEPGRQIACNAGLLLCTVLYTKKEGDKNFVVVDAAMTELIRPALYGAEHFVYPVALAGGAGPPPRRMDYAPPGAVKVDVVGGVCESADFLCKDRSLPPLRRGDLLAVFSAGAYGQTMSSQYNSRCRAPEVLVAGDQARLIRRRESYDDLLAAELDV